MENLRYPDLSELGYFLRGQGINLPTLSRPAGETVVNGGCDNCPVLYSCAGIAGLIITEARAKHTSNSGTNFVKEAMAKLGQRSRPRPRPRPR